TALEAYLEVKSKYPNATFTIAGNGAKLEEAKEFVRKNNLQDVRFLGNISENELINVFSKASIYILPSHSEGMPTSVLEAMAFGIPIISRPVGGLVDFFEEGKMGFLFESLDPRDYAKSIIYLLENPQECKKMG